MKDWRRVLQSLPVTASRILMNMKDVLLLDCIEVLLGLMIWLTLSFIFLAALQRCYLRAYIMGIVDILQTQSKCPRNPAWRFWFLYNSYRIFVIYWLIIRHSAGPEFKSINVTYSMIRNWLYCSIIMLSRFIWSTKDLDGWKPAEGCDIIYKVLYLFIIIWKII